MYAVYSTDSSVGPIITYVCRLHVLCFHFFDQNHDRCSERLLELYQHACALIDTFAREDAENDFILYSSQIAYRAIVLSAFIIIRILKSPIRELADFAAGERCLFTAIIQLKKRSLVNNDLDSVNVTILGLLWRSNIAFRNEDGSYDGLRMRSRMRGVCYLNLQ